MSQIVTETIEKSNMHVYGHINRLFSTANFLLTSGTTHPTSILFKASLEMNWDEGVA